MPKIFGSILLALATSILFTGCSLFSTRTPDEPLADAGTFSQPDTPEQVIDNIIAAVREMNALNYRRSLNDDLLFHPTATAEARESVFANWGRAQEDQYFTAAAAAAKLNTGHGLVLNDQSFTIVSDTQFLLDATYVLTINHRRPDAPSEVQGRLQWLIEQGSNGLWDLEEWTDQELGGRTSWSDLKAEFMK
ncbi:MAG: hypothetical protein BMS9Abin05_0602 [Rhodothermia bacterium]|nr:MAG: hypothetical protein BMS9Abin05_0602 [Rhodothermia bacterium]